MLLEDTRCHKEAALDIGLQQTILSHRFTDGEVTEVSILYSNKAFENTSIQWLVHTNQVCYFIIIPLLVTDALLLQPIQMFSDPGFMKMLDIAS
jgi:hypothetical protein